MFGGETTEWTTFEHKSMHVFPNFTDCLYFCYTQCVQSSKTKYTFIYISICTNTCPFQHVSFVHRLYIFISLPKGSKLDLKVSGCFRWIIWFDYCTTSWFTYNRMKISIKSSLTGSRLNAMKCVSCKSRKYLKRDPNIISVCFHVR